MRGLGHSRGSSRQRLFCFFFSSPEKRRYPFKASHSGRGGAVYCDVEGILWICVSKPIILTVGTDVPGCPNKISAGAVPGRNYKLLPALATNSPPDYSRSASRHPPYELKNAYCFRANKPLLSSCILRTVFAFYNNIDKKRHNKKSGGKAYYARYHEFFAKLCKKTTNIHNRRIRSNQLTNRRNSSIILKCTKV